MVSCGHVCIKKILKDKSIEVNFDELKLIEKDALTFADFKEICDFYNVEGKGYYMEFKNIPDHTILHLQIANFKHYIYLIRKGLFCIYYDNHGYHLIYKGILKFLYSNYVFIIE